LLKERVRLGLQAWKNLGISRGMREWGMGNGEKSEDGKLRKRRRGKRRRGRKGKAGEWGTAREGAKGEMRQVKHSMIYHPFQNPLLTQNPVFWLLTPGSCIVPLPSGKTKANEPQSSSKTCWVSDGKGCQSLIR
jgi:hypothetical protein